MSTAAATIQELLRSGEDESTALSEPGGTPLSYARLRQLVAATVATLNERGIGRNDRVAIVLDNGPHMATAFLGVAAGATAAPLNPGYRAEEFEFYLSDLNARLLIVESSDADKVSPAVAVAAKLSIPVARLKLEPEQGAGAFSLVFDGAAKVARAASPGPAVSDDAALVLHTSGTTSRPKIVPLAQRNVVASARN